MAIKATGPHFDFVMFVFKVERGRRRGRERMVSFCNALLLLEHRWEAEAQDPMWQAEWDFSLQPEGKRIMFEFC